MDNISLKIHPAIGLARVGNAEVADGGYYVGPVVAGGLPTELDGTPVQNFRDGQGRLRRQAAQFSVFVYDNTSPAGRVLRVGDTLEASDGSSSKTVADMRWTGWLANKKAGFFQFQQLEGEQGYPADAPLRNPQISDPAKRREQLIISAGAKTVDASTPVAAFSRDNSPTQLFPPPLRPHDIDTLGEIHRQSDGSCLLLGGLGHPGSMLPGAPSIQQYANNDGWFDDVADGPVNAVVVFDDGSEMAVASGAWCIVAPPAYAPQIPNMVTLDDVLFDLFVRTTPGYRDDVFVDGHFNPAYRPSFPDEIYPLLQRALLNQWVSAKAVGADTPTTTASTTAAPPAAHTFGALNAGAVENAQWLLSLMRPLGAANQPFVERTEVAAMPLLCGDNPISNVQVSKFLNLTATQLFMMAQWAAGNATDDPAKVDSPGIAIDRGVLANAVGGPFCPGIEATWIFRNPALFSEPYRIKPRDVGVDGLTFNGNVALGAQPGDLTARMAQPWQSDFNECSYQGISLRDENQNVDDHNQAPPPIYDTLWWPAQRPLAVYTAADKTAPAPWARDSAGTTFSDIDMVEHWWRLGFVIEQGSGGYVETDRSRDPFEVVPESLDRQGNRAKPHTGPKRALAGAAELPGESAQEARVLSTTKEGGAA